jgi:hypothetical protein
MTTDRETKRQSFLSVGVVCRFLFAYGFVILTA